MFYKFVDVLLPGPSDENKSEKQSRHDIAEKESVFVISTQELSADRKPVHTFAASRR